MQTFTLLALTLLPAATLAQHNNLYAREADLDLLDYLLEARDAEAWAEPEEDAEIMFPRELLDDEDFMDMLFARAGGSTPPASQAGGATPGAGRIVGGLVMAPHIGPLNKAAGGALQNTIKATRWGQKVEPAVNDHFYGGGTKTKVAMTEALQKHYQQKAAEHVQTGKQHMSQVRPLVQAGIHRRGL